MTVLGPIRGQTAESFLEIMFKRIPDEFECLKGINPFLGQPSLIVISTAIAHPITEPVAILRFEMVMHPHITMFLLVSFQITQTFPKCLG